VAGRSSLRLTGLFTRTNYAGEAVRQGIKPELPDERYLVFREALDHYSRQIADGKGGNPRKQRERIKTDMKIIGI
jgi:hypothetical protein